MVYIHKVLHRGQDHTAPVNLLAQSAEWHQTFVTEDYDDSIIREEVTLAGASPWPKSRTMFCKCSYSLFLLIQLVKRVEAQSNCCYYLLTVIAFALLCGCEFSKLSSLMHWHSDCLHNDKRPTSIAVETVSRFLSRPGTKVLSLD